MALIDLRDATIYLYDGLTGTATINDAAIAEGDSTLLIEAVKANGVLTLNDAGVITVTAAVVGTAWNDKSIVFDEQSGTPAGTPTAAYAASTLTITVNDSVNTTTANILTAVNTTSEWTAVETNGGEYDPANDDDVNATTAGGTNVPVLNSDDTDLIPVGARFTVPNTASQVFTVSARLPANAGPTTSITFTPIFTDDIPANAASLTFEPQRVAVTIGEGNLSYTEAQNMDYTLDRGNLDTVRQGDDVPVDVTMDFSYEFVTTGTSETITPSDALKGVGGASEWVSSSSDLCEPYAVDVEIDRSLSCGSVESELTILADYRWESLEFSLRDATISSSGKCNITTAANERS